MPPYWLKKVGGAAELDFCILRRENPMLGPSGTTTFRVWEFPAQP